MVTEYDNYKEDAKPPNYKLIMVSPTPFYYQVPIYQQLEANERIDLTVYFCSDEALSSLDLPVLYGSNAMWGDRQLLSGYKSKFMKNFSPLKSYLKTPLGLINFGIWRAISKEKPDAVVVMGWTNPTWWIAILACLFNGIPFFYMNDANVQAEKAQPKWKAVIKKAVLGRVLFRLATGFLSSGSANNDLYKYYGVSDSRLIPFGYSMVHKILLPMARDLRKQKEVLRQQLGLPTDSFVILFCGRFIKQKGLYELLDAYLLMGRPNTMLAFVGGGELEEDLKNYVKTQGMDSVRFFGFQSREELPKYYAMADLLVLPSWRETWGMVVNEALCFGLPVIVSDQVGAALDLVVEGENGFIFPVRNVDALRKCMDSICGASQQELSTMACNSLRLINEWSDLDLAESLTTHLDVMLNS